MAIHKFVNVSSSTTCMPSTCGCSHNATLTTIRIVDCYNAWVVRSWNHLTLMNQFPGLLRDHQFSFIPKSVCNTQTFTNPPTLTDRDEQMLNVIQQTSFVNNKVYLCKSSILVSFNTTYIPSLQNEFLICWCVVSHTPHVNHWKYKLSDQRVTSASAIRNVD